ncbi:hypothetical protein B0T18DRAFT_103855 [Schizothecium vesticola]|uniref:Uncharacterized protein n=1 Tax=Schizothecium vesticola TaxID=314040 RepID=A0AA40F1A7_9PEZI|nr:hypothetical protein B0T18DRAFT_103855 [Schizothecium vesticola]
MPHRAYSRKQTRHQLASIFLSYRHSRQCRPPACLPCHHSDICSQSWPIRHLPKLRSHLIIVSHHRRFTRPYQVGDLQASALGDGGGGTSMLLVDTWRK